MRKVHVLLQDRKSGRRFVQTLLVKEGHSIVKVIRGIRKVIKAKLIMWSVEG